MTQKTTKESLEDFITLEKAQTDMCKGYAFGSLGIVTSGMMWLVSALVSHYYSPKLAIWSLLIGGALISPVSSILGKLIGLKGHSAWNPLKNLAMENTIWMLMCIPIAYGLSTQNIAWFFQSMLLIIGGRYLTFSTLYGKKSYWVLGAILGVFAYLLFSLHAQSFVSLLAGGSIELFFGTFLYFSYRKSINED